VEVRVRVQNPAGGLAFQIHLSAVDEKSGEEILPVLWEDNYISLMPGESREISARYDQAVNAGRLKLEVNGWNIDAETLPVEEAKPASVGAISAIHHRGSIRQ
jgi:exo-1,4-beta-D-glucosaminidase